jgi:hypothetical protein
MNKSSMRLLALSVIFIGAFSVARASVASADFWGGFRFAGASNGDCLSAGTSIISSANPDRHNISAANSCHTSYQVKTHEKEKRSDGSIIIQCENLFTNDWRRCSIQNTTGSSDYWEWNVFIIQNGQTVGMGCNNKGIAYDQCYISND